jgi:uncharacterized membrane protein (DUF4010 family)
VAGFGQRAREEPAHVGAAAAGALFANLGSLFLYVGVVGAASPALVRELALPFGAGALVLLGIAAGSLVRNRELASLPAGGKARAFHISQALLLAGLMALLLLVSAFLQRQFGSTGVLLAAAAVALVEVQAAAASLAQLAINGQLAMGAAAWGLVLMLLVAGVAKSVLAFASGGANYGWRVTAGLAALPLVMAGMLALLAAG